MLKALQSQDFMRNPAKQIEIMRESGPLVKSKIPILGEVWLTTNHAATIQVLKNDDNFRVTKKDGQVVGVSWWMPRTLSRLTHNMLASDEPEHSRLRGVVDQAFHRGAVHKLEGIIRELAGNGARELFAESETADLVQRFARPFPLAVICELLGLPAKDQPKFMKWAQGLTSVNGVFSFLMAINRLRPLTRYIEERIEFERANGGVGLIHDLVNSDDQLSDDELIAMVFLLLFAGHETTTHLISGGVLALLAHPDQLKALREDGSRVDLAVEECLRFVSPVQSTKPRYVRQSCVVEGVELKAGDLVMPLLVAANFDPSVFSEPEVFDISRKPNRHIEFGTGVHFCLGHQLARLEMREAIYALFSTHDNLKLAVPANDIAWHKRFGLRSLKALPVTT